MYVFPTLQLVAWPKDYTRGSRFNCWESYLINHPVPAFTFTVEVHIGHDGVWQHLFFWGRETSPSWSRLARSPELTRKKKKKFLFWWITVHVYLHCAQVFKNTNKMTNEGKRGTKTGINKLHKYTNIFTMSCREHANFQSTTNLRQRSFQLLWIPPPWLVVDNRVLQNIMWLSEIYSWFPITKTHNQ